MSVIFRSAATAPPEKPHSDPAGRQLFSFLYWTCRNLKWYSPGVPSTSRNTRDKSVFPAVPPKKMTIPLCKRAAGSTRRNWFATPGHASDWVSGPDGYDFRLPRSARGRADHPPVNWILDEREVAEVFTVPLSVVLDAERYEARSSRWHGNDYTLYTLNWQGQKIWGATAAVLMNLITRMQNTHDQRNSCISATTE